MNTNETDPHAKHRLKPNDPRVRKLRERLRERGATRGPLGEFVKGQVLAVGIDLVTRWLNTSTGRRVVVESDEAGVAVTFYESDGTDVTASWEVS